MRKNKRMSNLESSRCQPFYVSLQLHEYTGGGIRKNSGLAVKEPVWEEGWRKLDTNIFMPRMKEGMKEWRNCQAKVEVSVKDEEEKKSMTGWRNVDDESKEWARESVFGRRKWDMSQAYSTNTHHAHLNLILLFVHCSRYKMVVYM